MEAFSTRLLHRRRLPVFVLKGTTYHFRRRVPHPLRPVLGKGEIWHSLKTSSWREAKARAAALYAITERIFREAKAMLETGNLASEVQCLAAQIEVASQLIALGMDVDLDGIEGDVTAIVDMIEAERNRFTEAHRSLETAFARFPVISGEPGIKLRSLGERTRTITGDLLSRDLAPAGLASLRDDLVALRADFASLKDDLTHPAPTTAATAKETPPAPMLSTVVEDFLAAMAAPNENHAERKPRWTASTCDENRAAFRIFIELMGDRPVNDYDRDDANEFKVLARSMPAHYGKARNGETGLEAIARAKEAAERGKPVRLMSLATVQKHFCAYRACWKWLKEKKWVADKPFSDHEFRGIKAKKRKKRNTWADEHLDLLFHYEPWYGADADRESFDYWGPLIAEHSGMRLEEIAHLRPTDVKRKEGVWGFDIVPQPDGWQPKTEAGERFVPVHSVLIALGILDLAAKRRRQGADRLFHDLSPDKYCKYGAGFSRRFGKVRVALGIPVKTDFHSFRHDVRTQLESAPIQERWIDGVLGHTRDEASEGATTYNKGLSPQVAKEVIGFIKCPVDLSHLLMGAQV